MEEPTCPDHQVPLVAREGRLVCPEAGCPRWAQLPAVPEDPEDVKAQKAREEAAAAKQKEEIEDPVKEVHENL